MQLDYVAIIVATLVQFVVGAIWYMPVFGKKWGEIHGFDKIPKAQQQAMMKQMPPYYVLQLMTTLLTAMMLSVVIAALPEWNVYVLVLILWSGFVVPTQVGAVIFGGTEGRWVMTKILIMMGGSLACLMAGAATLQLL